MYGVGSEIQKTRQQKGKGCHFNRKVLNQKLDMEICTSSYPQPVHPKKGFDKHSSGQIAK